MFQGMPVTMEDAEELRAAIIGANNDMAQPLFLKEQLLESTRASGMEPEVGASLLQMLSQHNGPGGVRPGANQRRGKQMPMPLSNHLSATDDSKGWLQRDGDVDLEQKSLGHHSMSVLQVFSRMK